MKLSRILAWSAVAATSVLMASTAVQADVSITYSESFADLIEPGIAAFQEATGENVITTVVPGNLDQRISVDFAGGAASDVVLFDSYRTAEYSESNFLAALNDQVANWSPWADYYDSVKSMLTVGGEVRGIPIDTDVRMLWYSKALFEKAGIAMPWQPKNWNDVLSAAKQIKAAAPDVQYPFYLPVGSKFGEATTMQGFYMVLLGADTPEGDRNRLRNWGEGKWIVDSPAIRATLGFYQDVFINENLSARDLYYSPDPWGDFRRAFLDGNIAIMSGGSWEFTETFAANGGGVPPLAQRKSVMGWAPFPGSGKEGAPVSTNVSGGWAIGVNEKADDKASAFKLIETILSPENYTRWVSQSGKLTTRRDAAVSASYQQDSYLASIAPLVATTTSRDTYPGYSMVSAFIQQASDSILEGRSVDEVVAEYKANMIDEFGEDAVMVIK
ncbi:MAG: extracellular solute-binding protein [Alphaproteobacteria bacterium]|nr:extracellular solute-binding protein [Alphaproteobacteria bacterium]